MESYPCLLSSRAKERQGATNCAAASPRTHLGSVSVGSQLPQ